MSFVLAEEKRVKWPVYINEPANGGKTTRRKIEIEYLIVDPEDWEGESRSVSAVLMENITDWDGVENPDKSPVEFCDENLSTLLKVPYARNAIWETYIGQVLTGAELKN